MIYQKVDGNSDLVRDKKSGAILNINRNEFDKAKAARAERFREKEELKTLKNDVSELKSMLQQLLEKS
tara:strand:+ start:367 stop:570 length:204 start_codon:yes stop_codon:yes gene_type:complete